MKSFEVVKEIVSEGGTVMFRGITPPLTSRVLTIGGMFGLYDFWLTHLNGDKAKMREVLKIPSKRVEFLEYIEECFGKDPVKDSDDDF